MPAPGDPTATLPEVGPAATRAYEWTRRAVLTGDIHGGVLITEGEVAEAVGVSRTPVREAFLRLQAEGMLRLYPKRGALVVPVTAAEIRDVMGARLLVEPWAFASVADRRRAAARPVRAAVAAEMRRLIETQVDCLEAGDDAGFQEADGALHTSVVAAAGNGVLTEFYLSLRDRQLRIGALAARIDTQRAAHILAEHRVLADAVAAGDGLLATSLVTAHIDATGTTLYAG